MNTTSPFIATFRSSDRGLVRSIHFNANDWLHAVAYAMNLQVAFIDMKKDLQLDQLAKGISA